MRKNFSTPFFISFFELVKDKELYLYSPIYSFVAENLIAEMEQNSDSDICLRINSPGGSVLAGWGIIAKIKEKTEGKIKIKVDGAAMSMACYALAYADEVECLDISKFMLHPADMYVSDETDQAFLDSMNADLRIGLEAKIDSKKLKKITGYSIADMFENKDCPDLHFNAIQAKDLGLVTKINKLNPVEAKAVNMRMFAAAAIAPVEDKTKNTVMAEIKTLDELKATYPVLYAEAVQKGKDKEYSRVMAINAYRKVDPKACAKMIKKGKEVNAEFMAEMNLKANSPEALAALAAESAKPITTPVVETTAKDAEAIKQAKELAEFSAIVDKQLGKAPVAVK